MLNTYEDYTDDEVRDLILSVPTHHSVSLASGQLASTQTSMVVGTGTAATGQAFVPSSDTRVTITLRNTSASLTETVILGVKLGSGTVYTLPQVTLPPKYGAIFANLSLDALDTLVGQSSDATTVDYRVMLATGAGPFEIAISDSSGNQGTVPSSSVVAITNLTGVEGNSTAAAGNAIGNAAALPAGTGMIYPTTAADGTKGVQLTASDQVTGRMVIIGNGVSTAKLVVYPPTGGTINGASANASYTGVANGSAVIAICLSGASNTWFCI